MAPRPVWAITMVPPTEPRSQAVAGAGAANAAGNGLLRSARLALAVGDVRRAAEFVEKAKKMRLNYQPLDDTPDRVEDAIRKYQELRGLDKGTEAYRRAYARNMVEQADALLRCGERDEAERLATQAAGMHVIYGPFEQKPQEMLERIAAVRRQSAGRALDLANPADLASAARSPATVAAAHQQAVVLVRQARDAIASGDLDRAERLARRPSSCTCPVLPIPPTTIVRASCCSICGNFARVVRPA